MIINALNYRLKKRSKRIERSPSEGAPGLGVSGDINKWQLIEEESAGTGSVRVLNMGLEITCTRFIFFNYTMYLCS